MALTQVEAITAISAVDSTSEDAVFSATPSDDELILIGGAISSDANLSVSGFTEIQANGNALDVHVFWKRASSEGSATYSVTGGASNTDWAFFGARYTGVDWGTSEVSDTDFDDGSVTSVGGAGNLEVSLAAGDWTIFTFGGKRGSNADMSWTNATEEQEVTSGGSGGSFVEAHWGTRSVSPGSTTSYNDTCSQDGSGTRMAAVILAFPEDAGGTTVEPGFIELVGKPWGANRKVDAVHVGGATVEL